MNIPIKCIKHKKYLPYKVGTTYYIIHIISDSSIFEQSVVIGIIEQRIVPIVILFQMFDITKEQLDKIMIFQ